MPRVARVVIAGCPHHVTQRGNNRQDVFFVDDDRRVYLEFLREQALRFALSIDAYCLMTNHVHLVATPATASSLAQAVGRTNWLYTQYVNRLHGRSGHLWQNRFFSCALDDARNWQAVIYVESNPVRAGMVRRAWEHPWSSAAAHVGLSTFGLLQTKGWPPTRLAKWKELLAEGLPADQGQAIRNSTLTGRPLGTDNFVSKFETLLGRRLLPLPVGRPKKEKIGDCP